MGLREKLEDKIKRKEAEILEYKALVRDGEAYIKAMQEAVKLLPRDGAENGTAESVLRPGSSAYKAMEVLTASNRPMHITEILKALELPSSKKNRLSIGGTISRYARKKVIFVKTAPNTFGLLAQSHGEPPEDFGTAGADDEQN